MSKAKLKDIQNSLEFSYGEMIRAAAAAQLDAIFDGDEAKAADLANAEDEARAKMLDARRTAMLVAGDPAKVKQLVDGLGGKTKEARDLLDKMRRTKEVLENIQKAAALATAILGTVAAIAV